MFVFTSDAPVIFSPSKVLGLRSIMFFISLEYPGRFSTLTSHSFRHPRNVSIKSCNYTVVHIGCTCTCKYCICSVCMLTIHAAVVYLQSEVTCRLIGVLEYLPFVSTTCKVVYIETIEEFVKHLNKSYGLCHFISPHKHYCLRNRFTEDLQYVHMYITQC